MGGTVVIIILLTAVVPMMIIMSGLAAAGLLGFVLKKDVDAQHEGSELLELSEKY
jgi:hypothetical protein